MEVFKKSHNIKDINLVMVYLAKISKYGLLSKNIKSSGLWIVSNNKMTDE